MIFVNWAIPWLTLALALLKGEYPLFWSWKTGQPAPVRWALRATEVIALHPIQFCCSCR
jgi:hypothetical protein